MIINLHPSHFPQLLLRYNKEQIIEIALRMTEQDGIGIRRWSNWAAGWRS